MTHPSNASKKPTIRDVAMAAGVSVGTASRVINKSGPVSERATRAVKEAIAQLDYNPDSVAQSLRSKRTHVIGCMIPDIANPVFSTLMKAVERSLQEKGYITLIASSDLSLDRELEIINLFRQRKVDGVMISLSDETHPKIRDALSRFKAPMIALDRQLPVAADAIIYEHADAMRQTVKYLYHLGHRRIALITGTEKITPTRERISGYRKAHEDQGIEIDPDLVRTGGISARHGLEETTALLAMDNPPTAIVAGANQTLVGVLRAVRRAGLSIPQDMSIVSCDDTPLAELMRPPVTVVRRDIAEWGRLAAEVLLNRLDAGEEGEGAPPAVLRMSCELLLRESCAPLHSA